MSFAVRQIDIHQGDRRYFAFRTFPFRQASDGKKRRIQTVTKKALVFDSYALLKLFQKEKGHELLMPVQVLDI
jgi:hypothetical protein